MTRSRRLSSVGTRSGLCHTSQKVVPAGMNSASAVTAIAGMSRQPGTWRMRSSNSVPWQSGRRRSSSSRDGRRRAAATIADVPSIATTRSSSGLNSKTVCISSTLTG